MHGAAFFSGLLFLVAWPDDRYAFEMHDYLFGYSFGWSRQYVRFPHDSLHCLDLFPGWEDYFAVESQQVPSVEDQLGGDSPGVDLILPCLIVALANT